MPAYTVNGRSDRGPFSISTYESIPVRSPMSARSAGNTSGRRLSSTSTSAHTKASAPFLHRRRPLSQPRDQSLLVVPHDGRLELVCCTPPHSSHSFIFPVAVGSNCLPESLSRYCCSTVVKYSLFTKALENLFESPTAQNFRVFLL